MGCSGTITRARNRDLAQKCLWPISRHPNGVTLSSHLLNWATSGILEYPILVEEEACQQRACNAHYVTDRLRVPMEIGGGKDEPDKSDTDSPNLHECGKVDHTKLEVLRGQVRVRTVKDQRPIENKCQRQGYGEGESDGGFVDHEAAEQQSREHIYCPGNEPYQYEADELQGQGRLLSGYEQELLAHDAPRQGD